LQLEQRFRRISSTDAVQWFAAQQFEHLMPSEFAKVALKEAIDALSKVEIDRSGRKARGLLYLLRRS
jgi:hypothetical protein